MIAQTFDEWNTVFQLGMRSWIEVIPNSTYVIIARQAEHKALIKNFINVNEGVKVIRTGVYFLVGMFVSHNNKLVTFFDSAQPSNIQFQLDQYIGCPQDPLVTSCSKLKTYVDVECVPNATFDIKSQKCYCNAGYFLNSALNQCQECLCKDVNGFCTSEDQLPWAEVTNVISCGQSAANLLITSICSIKS